MNALIKINMELLCSNHQVFALSDSELGETDLVEHNIETVDNQPVRVYHPVGYLMH